jgi:uncharacterized membrane protein
MMPNNSTHGAPEQPAAAPPANLATSALSDFVSRLVIWIARHWLALFNSAWAVYVLLPFLAPILMQAGYTAPARLIYGLYSFTCHQLPDHSFFLFGDTHVPLAPELEAAGAPPQTDLFVFRKFTGNEQIGYKVALCERDVAIYGSVVLAGLAFAVARRRIQAPSIKVYLLFLIPIAVDGLSQLAGLRESNWWLRTLTGAIFGAASVWLAYPYVEDAMRDVVDNELQRQKGLPNA